MLKYILSGHNLIDHIIPYGRPEDAVYRIGGSVGFALSAMNIFGEGILNVSYAGTDFDRFFGDWYRENGFSTEGITIPYDRTHCTELYYQANGTYLPVQEKYGRNEPNMDLFAPWLASPELRGIHILGHGNAVFFEQLAKVRERGVRIGYEMGVMEGMYVDVDSFVKEVTDNYLDYFSLSISETCELWPSIRDTKDALEFFAGFKCPVFLRLGLEGAYMIDRGMAYFSPLVDEFGSVDPTGCGNSSTAAAFLSLCEGDSPLEAAYVGAVAASATAAQLGFIPKVDDKLKARCRKLVKELVKDAREGFRI